jgi:hypothetical protein
MKKILLTGIILLSAQLSNAQIINSGGSGGGGSIPTAAVANTFAVDVANHDQVIGRWTAASGIFTGAGMSFGHLVDGDGHYLYCYTAVCDGSANAHGAYWSIHSAPGFAAGSGIALLSSNGDQSEWHYIHLDSAQTIIAYEESIPQITVDVSNTRGYKLSGQGFHTSGIDLTPNACGTGPSIVDNSSDNAGEIVVGTSPTSAICSYDFEYVGSWKTGIVCFANDITATTPAPLGCKAIPTGGIGPGTNGTIFIYGAVAGHHIQYGAIGY